MLKYEYLYSIVYFLRTCLGFLQAPGLPTSARAPICKKPLPVLIFRVVLSKCCCRYGFAVYFPACHYVQVAFYRGHS